MEFSNSNYCIILAGGRGKRLWPSSRMERPKQFVDFFGTGRTQLQTTFDRMAGILPKENIFVCTCKEYEHWVHEQLPELADGRLMTEPVNRNTAPAVAWVGVCIHRECSRKEYGECQDSYSDDHSISVKLLRLHISHICDYEAIDRQEDNSDCDN